MSATDNTWCRMLFGSLADGGIWGVPRSGLVFTKKADRLVLTSAMPHDPAMPLTEDELREYQDDDFEVIRSHFNQAGITVEKEVP
jgi:hypothetical protein